MIYRIFFKGHFTLVFNSRRDESPFSWFVVSRALQTQNKLRRITTSVFEDYRRVTSGGPQYEPRSSGETHGHVQQDHMA
jgi:hypothetical protein